MSDHCISSPNLLLDVANSTLGFRRLSAKTRIGWGEAFSGMITTLFHGHPEQYLHTLVALARTRHTPLQRRAPPTYSWHLCFSCLGRCCTSGFGSVKTFLAALAFCTVFTAFAHCPTTCGLAVSSTSSLQLQLLSQFWGKSLCNFSGCDS